LVWYAQLYREQFRDLESIESLNVLEIGSGVSPLQHFYPTVRTSDVLDLEYVDYVFDCHDIDKIEAIADRSLDVITLTNVVHHLERPLEFFRKAAAKLKTGGVIIATEPYFSVLSTFIYKYLHHEPVDFSIESPELREVVGPLSSANSPLAWLIFTRPQWRKTLEEYFTFERGSFRPFSALSYFVSGGIARRIPIPNVLYRMFFPVDLWLSRLFPKLFASFFIITLTRK
jgi:SAM-dependent methyltransferase